MSNGFVQWNEVEVGGSGSKTDFLRLKTGNTYKIRPLFLPVHFYKYFHKVDKKLRTAICPEEVVAVLSKKYPEDVLKKPANRFVMFVIDRADGAVKIMEFPISVYSQFRSSFEATGKKPGSGQKGGDWQIKVAGAGFNTTYTTTFIQDSPLSDEEKEKVKVALGGDAEKLKKIYKFCTLEEAEKKLFSDEEDGEEEESVVGSSAVDASGDEFDPEW